MSGTTKLSALVLGGVMAAAMSMSFSSGASAAVNDDTFCRAIGIAQEMRLDCVNQMAAAASPDAKDQVAAAWVAKSPLASNSPSSLYKPPTDANAKNGTPGTPYQDKVNVPNEVNAQIHRAMKINHLEH
ncbi:MAG: hypothetical protein ACYCZX_11330 [Rhodospirillaceae bacterium]